MVWGRRGKETRVPASTIRTRSFETRRGRASAATALDSKNERRFRRENRLFTRNEVIRVSSFQIDVCSFHWLQKCREHFLYRFGAALRHPAVLRKHVSRVEKSF